MFQVFGFPTGMRWKRGIINHGTASEWFWTQASLDIREAEDLLLEALATR